MERVTRKHDIRTCGGVGATLGFAGGILAALLGSLMTVASWVAGAESQSWLHALSTMLLVSTIPLLALGAFCLDGLEAKSARRRHQRRHLLREGAF